MADLRLDLKKIALATLADEIAHHAWVYEAIRPMAVPPSWKPGQRVVGDCSKGVQFLNRWVGAPDPMREDYGPYGNSQTLWLRLQHLDPGGVYDARLLRVGDVVTFGHDGDEHAAMVLEAASEANGWDPLLWSFGHPGTPNTYRLSWDRRPRQYLRNPLPAYVPTPLEQARARTGWFAWVAWKLGEGDYLEFGRANAKARPNVPKVIPASWWRRYAKFLLRRKRANPPNVPVLPV